MTKTTEQRHPLSENIDILEIYDILNLINSEDKIIPEIIKKNLMKIEKIIENVIYSFKNGGRLYYVGSGTSGRLGVLDASECPPTFKVSELLVQGIIAGGKDAMYKSIEGAEDSYEDGCNAIQFRKINSNDCVIGISASGNAKYVLGALETSHNLNAYTSLITFNDIKKVKYISDIISIIIGPELITGSTRMKAGTATKMILNMISTVSMIKSNKVYKNYMVDLKVCNNKLRNRAINIIKDLTQLSSIKSKTLLKKANNNVKIALVMNHLSINYKNAQIELKKFDGNLRNILE